MNSTIQHRVKGRVVFDYLEGEQLFRASLDGENAMGVGRNLHDAGARLAEVLSRRLGGHVERPAAMTSLPVGTLRVTEAPRAERLRLERDLTMTEARHQLEVNTPLPALPSQRDVEMRVAAQFQPVVQARNWRDLRLAVRALGACCILCGEAMGFCGDEADDDPDGSHATEEQRGKVSRRGDETAEPSVELAMAHEVPQAGGGPSSMNSRTFQNRVVDWVNACFGNDVMHNHQERCHRFIEEALELVQACGMPRADALLLVDYVYGRPAGARRQEIGGAMLTLASLAECQGYDMLNAGEAELARVWKNIEKIRAKQAAKPASSPLPGPSVPAPAHRLPSDAEINEAMERR